MSNYEFSLRQEVLLEKGADILGSLFHFARNNHISPSDKKDPVNVVDVYKRQHKCGAAPGKLDGRRPGIPRSGGRRENRFFASHPTPHRPLPWNRAERRSESALSLIHI